MGTEELVFFKKIELELDCSREWVGLVNSTYYPFTLLT
jgi:hypothetical protein